MKGNNAATTYIAPKGAITTQVGKLAYIKFRKGIPNHAGIQVAAEIYKQTHDHRVFLSEKRYASPNDQYAIFNPKAMYMAVKLYVNFFAGVMPAKPLKKAIRSGTPKNSAVKNFNRSSFLVSFIA